MLLDQTYCIVWSTYQFSWREFTTRASNSVYFTVFLVPFNFWLWYLQYDDTQWWESLHYQCTSNAWPGCGGAEHLEEQLASLQIPSVTKATFIQLEHHLGTVFEQIVSDNLLAAGKEERNLAIANDEYHGGVPAIIVVVDGGWSKRFHKHSYNAKQIWCGYNFWSCHQEVTLHWCEK